MSNTDNRPLPRIVVRPDAKAYLELACLPHPDKDGNMLVGGRCRFRLGELAVHGGPADQRWAWDGNGASPTISPSVNCQSCGKHVTIVQGVER